MVGSIPVPKVYIGYCHVYLWKLFSKLEMNYYLSVVSKVQQVFPSVFLSLSVVKFQKKYSPCE